MLKAVCVCYVCISYCITVNLTPNNGSFASVPRLDVLCLVELNRSACVPSWLFMFYCRGVVMRDSLL